MSYFPTVYDFALSLKDANGGDWLSVPLPKRLACYQRAEREHFAERRGDPDLIPVRPEWIAQDMLNTNYRNSSVGR